MKFFSADLENQMYEGFKLYIEKKMLFIFESECSREAGTLFDIIDGV